MNSKNTNRTDDWAATSGPQEGPLTGRWFFYAVVGVPSILVVFAMLTPCICRARPMARTAMLVSAAAQGDASRVGTLIKLGGRGFEVNARTPRGQTPLMAASASGKVKVVEVLLCRGADVTLRDVDGETALSLAHRRWNGEVERLLRAGGAKD